MRHYPNLGYLYVRGIRIKNKVGLFRRIVTPTFQTKSMPTSQFALQFEIWHTPLFALISIYSSTTLLSDRCCAFCVPHPRRQDLISGLSTIYMPFGWGACTLSQVNFVWGVCQRSTCYLGGLCTICRSFWGFCTTYRSFFEVHLRSTCQLFLGICLRSTAPFWCVCQRSTGHFWGPSTILEIIGEAVYDLKITFGVYT